MRIGLIDIDSHARVKKFGATIYPNLALCKISSYYKATGHEVFWYDSMFSGHCDKVYMSKIFNFSTDYTLPIDADEIIRGGTGYNLTSKLEGYIDCVQPDYSIYPTIPKSVSYGFLTRGCPNKCPWCVVPRKEGGIQPYWDIEDVANGNQKVVLMDNNILAAGDYAHEQFDKIISMGLKVDFNQALDARLMTDDFAKQMVKIHWLDHNRIRFGCDTHKQIEDCERAIEMLESYGFKGQFFLYTMIGGKNDIHECYSRIHHWWQRNRQARMYKDRCAVYPYAQPYRNPDRLNEIPQWQKDMAGWVNKKMIFEISDFKDFQPRKGFKCSEYLR